MMTSVHSRLTLLTWMLFVASSQGAEPNPYVRRDFIINAALCSYQLDGGIEGYDQLGSGMVSARSSLGLGVRIGEASASAEIKPRVDEGRFLVDVDLSPENVKSQLGFKSQALDLTDLKPTAIQLGTDEDGRVYQLNLTPSVRVLDFTPQPFEEGKLELENWRFPNSPVLVDSAIFVGEISCAQGPVAMLDISGVALVEFSLVELKGSRPWGSLTEGVVTLAHPTEGTKIKISNVRNGGPYAVKLPGGPYRVWVRWSAPTRTAEEHREALVRRREQLVSEGYPAESIALLDKELARVPSPAIYSAGVGGVEKGDRVKDE